jgi:threonyl-tRNA synthetase
MSLFKKIDIQTLYNYHHITTNKYRMNHLEIGQKQELFFFDEYSNGCCYFLPNGTIIYNKLQSFIRDEYFKREFQEVKTPIMAKQGLWETSGHWQKYKDNMFTFQKDSTDDIEYGLSAMNCPKHCQIFKHKARSYKELPIRLADCGVLHRHELSGSVTSLTRNYSFCQDDAHIFCTMDQISSEMKSALEFLKSVYDKYGFKFTIGLSTRPDIFMGEPEQWDIAEAILADTLNNCGFAYTINEKDGAFYGPKIDIKLSDSLNRQHQCATIQLDFQLPINFKLKYVDANNVEQTPIMIHRAIYGSFERFIAILCEHYQGKWPLWLSPFQVKILPIDNKCVPYALNLKSKLMEYGYHVKIDDSDLKLNKKIRNAQEEQYNYILVIGNKEVTNNSICVRYRDNKELKNMSIDDFINELKINCNSFL